MTALACFLDDDRVGELIESGGKLAFTYDSARAAAISVRLPARAEPYDDTACRPFFSNLLPEGDWRVSLCRKLGVAPEDDFGLLTVIGGDCAGAIALRPARKKSTRARYVAVTEPDLRKWVKNPAARPAPLTTPGLRLSLAGAQDKLLIHLTDDGFFLCESGAPSTWILKPNIHDPGNAIDLSALNELLSMTLAQKTGVRTPRTRWLASAYAVARFDRFSAGERVKRLGQEDFAQVLGLPASSKYDVTWKECFELVSRYSSTPAPARVELVERLLFNVILGNHDAHAKNFALLRDPTGDVALSPAYDLVSTELYPSLSRDFAMAVGDARRLPALDVGSWKQFAKVAGVAFPFVRERAVALADAATAALDGLLEDTVSANPSLVRDVYPLRRRADFARRFAKVVKANAALVRRSVVAS
jgi:serine/threonine-protein kinase HipA